MKIGILREEKVPVDRRVPFSPSQCKRIEDNFPNLQIYVQSSNIRCFSDQEYIDHGITVLDNLESYTFLHKACSLPPLPKIAIFIIVFIYLINDK